jgi:nucleoside-diphosphate-sugar epimerase
MNSKAVVVTGGAGFAGSHLVADLLERWYKIIILDDLFTGRLRNIRLLIEPSWYSAHLFCHCETFIPYHSDPERSEGEESPSRSGLS